ncbi:MAG: TrmH family RNA methyltransferase [Anaerolineae bacterium]
MPSLPPYPIRQCVNERCRFRFPVTDERRSGGQCPRCGAATILAAHSLQFGNRVTRQTAVLPEVRALLDNIRSVYNVGSMFRTADGAGLTHLYLCGITPAPGHPRLAKTSLGAEQNVAWSSHRNGVDTAVALVEQGFRLWALESSENAGSLFDAPPVQAGPPIVLVVGNEISGVDPGILAQCERTLALPMQGRKQSLNVSVAFGVAAYMVCHAANGRPESVPKNR